MFQQIIANRAGGWRKLTTKARRRSTDDGRMIQ
jgi:hypothetical protein